MELAEAVDSNVEVLPDGFAWLSRRHRGAIVAHWLKLDAADRMRRFGAPRSDDEVRRFALELDFSRDWFLGAHALHDGLAGVVQARPHLVPQRFMVEAALSVDVRYRGRGIARGLLEALVRAIHTLSASNVVTMERRARREPRELLAELGATGNGVAHEVVSGIHIAVDRTVGNPCIAGKDCIRAVRGVA